MAVLNDVKDVLIALNSLKKKKTTDVKYYYEYISSLKYSEAKKRIYSTHAIVVFHKEKQEDEYGHKKVVRVEDERLSFNTILDVYVYLGSEYNRLTSEGE